MRGSTHLLRSPSDAQPALPRARPVPEPGPRPRLLDPARVPGVHGALPGHRAAGLRHHHHPLRSGRAVPGAQVAQALPVVVPERGPLLRAGHEPDPGRPGAGDEAPEARGRGPVQRPRRDHHPRGRPVRKAGVTAGPSAAYPDCGEPGPLELRPVAGAPVSGDRTLAARPTGAKSITTRRLLAGLALAALVAAAARAQEYVPGELLVRWKPRLKAEARTEALRPLGARRLQAFALPGLERVAVEGVSVEEAVARLELDPRVEYAEPNLIWSISRAPNDPRYPELYGLHNTGQTGGVAGADISAEAAWDRFTGDPELLVGVLDTGAQLDHPDLAANLWTNPGEIPGNGRDDDQNGYVDDVHGYDFANHDPDPTDDNGHGTHTAGTIAAVGNNGLGVTGVVWHARIVVLKFLGASGTGETSAAVEALEYAMRLGIKVTNNSWGSGLYSRALDDAVAAAGAAGQLFVAAAGNARSDTDMSPQYPSALAHDCVVSVAATDAADQLASFSNYGAVSVDLAAPGVDVLSTTPGGTYRLLSGTSMASPHVAGAAAFLFGRFPGMSAQDVKSRLLVLVDPLPGLAGRCVSGGRLNLALAATDPDSLAPGGITDLAVAAPGSNSMALAWTATGDDGALGTAARYELRMSEEPITPENFETATRIAAPLPALAGEPQSWRVRGLATTTSYWFALLARDEFGNPGTLSNVVSGTTLGPPSLALAPTSVSATANTGSAVTRTVEIHNDSQGTLEWSAPPPELEFGEALGAWPAETGEKGVDSAPREPSELAAGGPDAVGSRWADSSEPGGPAFQWVDVVAPEHTVPLSGDEAVSAPRPLGFSFPFYGRRFTSVRVCTNGYLQFGNEGPVYVNSGLPSKGGPRNMIAPFWDDLQFGAGTDHAYLRTDGTRCIVTWQAVPRFNDPQSVMTFQCILYPSGEIRFQYRSMTGNTSNATAGIQDSSRSVGLTVAFNQPYVRDSLAVRLAPLRQWLTVLPAEGFLRPGERQAVVLRLDASGLASGTYRGRARILTNDPAARDTAVTAQLDVIGAPHLTLSPGALDFGTHFLGSSETLELTIANDGVDPLVVSELSSDSPSFAVAGGGFTLLPGDALTRPVTFTPDAIAEHSGSLRVASNDPAQLVALLPLRGVASAAPEIETDAPRLHAAASNDLHPEAAVREQVLLVRNSGGSPLEWTASTYQGSISLPPVRSASRPAGTPGRATDGPPGWALAEGGPASGPAPMAVAQVKGTIVAGSAAGREPAALGSGGPDAFGYRWVDSDEADGPRFAWEEIAAMGTRLFGDADDSTTTIPLPFPFRFYGQVYQQLHVCTNGFVSFVSRDTSFVNTDLPSAAPGVPRALVAPLWTDLDLRRGSGGAFARFDGSKLIVEWKDAVHYSGASPFTFQVLLWPSGMIEYQYLSVGPLVSAATTGIQESSGTVGLGIAFNTHYARPGLRVRIVSQDDWLTLDRAGGTTPPGGVDTLRVRFDARPYPDGDLAGELRITSNDVDQPLLVVPCELHVGVARPEAEAQPGAVPAISRAPIVQFTVTPPPPGDALLTGSLRLAGQPLPLAGEPGPGPEGRFVLLVRALDLLRILPQGIGPDVALTGEFAQAGWFECRPALELSAPALEGGPLPAFGAGGAPAVLRVGETTTLAWSPPAGGSADYVVALSADGGERWSELGRVTMPGFSFVPGDTSSSALLEVVARAGDQVLGTWLSAPFRIEAADAPPPPPAQLALRRTGGNPATAPVALVLSLPVAGSVRVDVFDLRGARIRTLAHGPFPAGRHPLAWDGRNDAGATVRAGFYIARVQAPGGEAGTRFTLLR